MSFMFRPAARTNSKLFLAIYGESGSGKTYSALMLARGLAGPTGKVMMIDTESRRGELYADVIPGGYDVAQLEAPFSPERYMQAIDAAEKAGAAVLVIDSMSHEWEGIGGVLDMASEIEKRTGKPGLHCWKEPKLQHKRLMLKLLQTPLHIVACVRAHHKSRQVKNERTGKSEIVKDEDTTPTQAEDFIFECTAHMEVLRDHRIRLTKCSHPQMRPCFPTDRPISVETGQALAAWCAGGSAPATDWPTFDTLGKWAEWSKVELPKMDAARAAAWEERYRGNWNKLRASTDPRAQDANTELLDLFNKAQAKKDAA